MNERGLLYQILPGAEMLSRSITSVTEFCRMALDTLARNSSLDTFSLHFSEYSRMIGLPCQVICFLSDSTHFHRFELDITEFYWVSIWFCCIQLGGSAGLRPDSGGISAGFVGGAGSIAKPVTDSLCLCLNLSLSDHTPSDRLFSGSSKPFFCDRVRSFFRYRLFPAQLDTSKYAFLFAFFCSTCPL